MSTPFSDAIAERWASARHETAIVRPNKNAEPSRVTVEENADSSEMLISQNFMMSSEKRATGLRFRASNGMLGVPIT
jgi:hypothetical protein